tara:strand:+ start:272 stop:883 length:612 start_codon:yes stop_codon:yes gene_type:complete
MLKIDHIVLAAANLSEGLSFSEERLGVSLDPGGSHDQFGTHNKLLNLGDCYLEVIAIDLKARKPDRKVWYDLEVFSGAPHIVTWVCETDRMQDHLKQLPYHVGKVLSVSRGTLEWNLTVPKNGSLPMSGCAPSLIDWKGAASPATKLPDRGYRLSSLTLSHPKPTKLANFIKFALNDPRIIFKKSKHVSLRAKIKTPAGLIEL